MKNVKNVIGLSIIAGLLVGIVVVLLDRKQGPLPKEKDKFDAVTSRLDMGGNFLFYMKTDQVHERVDNYMRQLKGGIANGRSYGLLEMDTALRAFDMVYQESGIKGIDGMGMSSAEIEDGIFRNKAFLLKAPEADGLLWNLYGGAGHDLESLNMLPANTVLATASDIDHKYIWSWLKKLVNKANPEIARGLNELVSKVESNPEVSGMIADFGTHAGLFVTMDPDKTLNLPLGRDAVAISSPSACLFVKVENESVMQKIVDKIKGKAPLTEQTIEGKKAFVLSGNAPMPLQISPTITTAGGYLFVGLTTDVVEETLAVMEGKKDGLVKTDAFKLAAKGMKLEGNSYHFIGPELGKTLKILVSKLPANMRGPEGAMLRTVLPDPTSDAEFWSFGTVSMLSNGIALEVRSTDNSGAGALLQFTGAPAAMLAGMALPAVSKARNKARRANSAGNLKQLGLGLLMYSGDYAGFFPTDQGAKGLNYLIADQTLPMSKVYVNPRDDERSATFDGNAKRLKESTTSYAYVGSGLRDDNVNSTEIPTMWEKPCGDDWINVLFIDGHVSSIKGSFQSNADIARALSRQFRWDASVAEFFLKKARAFDEQEAGGR